MKNVLLMLGLLIAVTAVAQDAGSCARSCRVVSVTAATNVDALIVIKPFSSDSLRSLVALA